MASDDGICKLLSRMKLAEKSAISLEKFEPEYILHLDAQSSSGSDAKLASTSSKFSIRIYSRETLALSSNIKGHEKPLTGVKFSQESPHFLYSSSQDGVIKCWDLRTNPDYSCQTFDGYELENKRQLSCFDVSCNDKFLCAGTTAKNNEDKEMESHLIFWDCRKLSTLGVYKESHADDMTQVKFHPTNPDLFLSGSTDGLVCLFDISEANEEDALQATFNSESSVARTGWCGKNSENAFCLTHIETFIAWNTDTMEEVSSISGLHNNKNNIDYLVDCFQPKSSENPILVAGNNNGHMKFLEVLGNETSPVTSLDQGHTDIVRCISWDDQSQTMVTGGEDAMLCLWSQHHQTLSPSAAQSKNTYKVQKRDVKKKGPYRKR